MAVTRPHPTGIALLAILLLAACTGQVGPTPTPEDTSTPAPTATRTPTPTRTPSPTPGPGLDDLLMTPVALLAAADLDGARAAYVEIADLYPASADPWLGLAAVALREGDSQTALEYLERAVEIEPENREALRQWALLAEQEGDYATLIGVYDRMLALDGENPDLLVARAMAHARLGEGEPADDDLLAAQALDPYREYAWLNVAGAAYGARQYPTAIQIAGAGVETYRDSNGLRLLRGLANLSQNNVAEALVDFEAILRDDELHVEAHLWRGRGLAMQGRYAEAIPDLQRAGELGVQSGVVSVNFAYEAMADAADAMGQSGDVSGAFAYLAQQVVQFGSRDALLLGYGRVRWRQGNINLALDYMDDLVSSGYAPALYWRAAIFAEEGRDDEAIADLRAYLETRTAGPEAEAARALLESLGAGSESDN